MQPESTRMEIIINFLVQVVQEKSCMNVFFKPKSLIQLVKITWVLWYNYGLWYEFAFPCYFGSKQIEKTLMEFDPPPSWKIP